MRTTRWAAIGVLAALVLAAGCSARTPAEAEGRNLVRPALGLAIDVPQGWTFRDLAGDVVLEIYPSSGEAAGPTGPKTEAEAAKTRAARATPVVHVVVIDREGLALGAWADQAAGEAKEMTTGLEETGRKSGQLSDGRETLLLELRNPHGVRPLVQRMLLVMTDTRAYAVIATAPEGDLASAAPAFDKCFSSLVVW